jgi:hypothetical protein
MVLISQPTEVLISHPFRDVELRVGGGKTSRLRTATPVQIDIEYHIEYEMIFK